MTMDDIYKTYPHNPPHYFVPNAMYIVTGSLSYKRRLLSDDKRKAIYNARLHYVHLNPVKHGSIENAEDYPFCSYKWFLDMADDAFRITVMDQPIDRVDIFDDFD